MRLLVASVTPRVHRIWWRACKYARRWVEMSWSNVFLMTAVLAVVDTLAERSICVTRAGCCCTRVVCAWLTAWLEAGKLIHARAATSVRTLGSHCCSTFQTAALETHSARSHAAGPGQG